MAQAERFFLPDVGDVDHVGYRSNDLQQVGFLALFEHFFELVADIEVVFDGLFAAAGDDDDLIAARGHGLFDAILDDGLVHEREHFFGLGLGGWQKTSA